MRIELNLETGEQSEHEDAPVTWVEPVVVAPIPPTKEELLVELELLTAKIQALGAI
jgi:hypothetical protein